MARWNANVADGHDPEFSRGVSAHDRFWGDAAFGMTPQTTLGPLDTAPYHAVRVHSGCLGTKGGPRTDGTPASSTSTGTSSPASTPPATSCAHRWA